MLAMYRKMKNMLKVKKSLELRNKSEDRLNMLREKYKVLDEAYEEFERIVLTVLVKDLPKNMG